MNIENWANNFIDRGSQQTHNTKLNLTSISTSMILRHLWPRGSGGFPQTRLSSVIYMLESQVFTHFAPRGCSSSMCPQDTPRKAMCLYRDDDFALSQVPPTMHYGWSSSDFHREVLLIFYNLPLVSKHYCLHLSKVLISYTSYQVPQTIAENKRNRQKWWKRQSEHSGGNKK